MENISPNPHPVGRGESGPITFSNGSPSSSLGLTPLLQQPSPSDCSGPPNSIGSSSAFSVRPLNSTSNQLSTVSDAAVPTSSAPATASGAMPSPDSPTSLPPFSEWVPANNLIETSPVILNSNEDSDSEMIEDGPNIEIASTSLIREVVNGVPADMKLVDADSAMVNESSDRPPVPAITLSAPTGTAPTGTDIPEAEPLDEEIHQLMRTKDSQGKCIEVFDLPKTSRARIYNYYIGRVRSLKILCDQGKAMTDLPVHCEEDYALLKTLTKTHGDVRWWIIMINDLQCPECVLLLKARRRESKSSIERAWLRVKGKFKQVCLCGDNSHDFVCHHTRKDMNKVTRFFHTLGEKNASRMVNIALETNPIFHVDIDVLASAVYNTAKYFKHAKQLSINFHFHTTHPIESERAKSIVCSMVKLEAILPKGARLLVCGVPGTSELMKEWCKRSRSRKWWL